MRLVIATPTGIVIDNRDVASTRAEDASGSFGILDGHADFLTALSVCVVSWREKNGAQRFCAVRRGTLAVRNGSEVSIATREALVGDDLELSKALFFTNSVKPPKPRSPRAPRTCKCKWPLCARSSAICGRRNRDCWEAVRER